MHNKHNPGYYVSVFLSMVTALPAGLLVGYTGIRGDLSLPVIYLLMILSILAALFLQVAIHEAGHLLFGLLTGYTFRSYRIGSLVITRNREGLHFGRFSLSGTLGQCLMGPPDDRSKNPYFLYNAGGVILNLVSAFICVMLFRTASSPALGIFLIINAAYALIMLFSNGIPAYVSGIANDGMNILELHSSPQTLTTFWNTLDTNRYLTEGGRLRDLPDDLFDLREETLHSGSIGASNILQKCAVLIDRHAFAEADELTERVLNADYPLTGNQRNALLLERKYLECLNGNPSPVQDKKLEKLIRAGAKSSPSVIRYLYAKALCENDTASMETLLEDFAKLENTYPFKGEYEGEKELMKAAEEILCPRTETPLI